MPQEKMTRKEKRQAARVERKIELENKQKLKRKKRIQAWLIGSGVGLLSIGIIASAIIFAPKPVEQTYPINMANDAVTLKKGMEVVNTPAIVEGEDPVPLELRDDRVEVEVYLDYLCPYCKLFDTVQKPIIEKYLMEEDVVFSFHPLGFLSAYSGTASNASACVASKQPELWWQANNLLYEKQPDEATAKGFTEKASSKYILDAWKDLSLKADTVKCINELPHMKWAAEATNRALQGPIPNSTLKSIAGTPTVLVDGVKLDFDFSSDTANFDIALSNALNNARANK